MGGNALKEISTRRVSKEEYFDIRDDVLDKLRSFCDMSGSRMLHDCMDILAYRTKETFGDLDVLVETKDGDSVNYMDMIHKLFNPNQVVHNTNVYSFDYKNFQVDLILTPTDYFNTSYHYYAWNDLGNLAGRIYKKLGFKYGHKGLSYIFRKEDESHSAFAEIVISKDIKQIFEFGDLDYDKFMLGFDTLEDIFRWVSSSKYFHKDIYLFHNRNHISRTRDMKRKVYHEFLEWCAITEGLNSYPWTEMREQDVYAGKPEFLRLALKQFDGFAEQHCKILFLHECDLRVKAKFNGDVVRSITGFEGKELGAFMQEFIKIHGGKSLLWSRLLHATSAEIDSMIREYAANKT